MYKKKTTNSFEMFRFVLTCQFASDSVIISMMKNFLFIFILLVTGGSDGCG